MGPTETNQDLRENSSVALLEEPAATRAPAAPPPWKRSWLYRAPGETPTFVWIVGLHLLVPVGLWLLPFPGWPVVWVAAVLYALGGLGTTVAYHRSLAHSAFKLNRVVEHPLVFCAVFNGSGNPLTWVANHRYHHAHSDTERDVSSPRQGGLWWSHLRWLWQATQASPARYCPDLIRRGYQSWGRWQIAILALSAFGGLALAPWLGWIPALSIALWLGPVRLLLALHVQCSVNSICHLGTVTTEHGSGKNVWWLAPLHMFQGENWHANHHELPHSPRLGHRWWEIDTGWWTIVALKRLALVEKLRGANRRIASSRQAPS